MVHALFDWCSLRQKNHRAWDTLVSFALWNGSRSQSKHRLGELTNLPYGSQVA
jgi:hypothetical protein